MTTNVNDLLKPIRNQGTVITNEHQDSSLGVKEYFCSAFIKKKGLLVKGEYDNKNESRRPLIVVLDPLTGDVKGRSRFLYCNLREGTDIL